MGRPRAGGSGLLGAQNGSRCVRGRFWSAGAPNCLWRTEKAPRGPTRRSPSSRRLAAGPRLLGAQNGSRCVRRPFWSVVHPIAPGAPRRRLGCSPARCGRGAAGRCGPARPASLSAASLVACPCVTNLAQLRTTSQSLTTMVVGYSLSFRPPPSSHTMTSSTRAP